MNMTMILFQIGFDRFSAIAVDVDQPKHIWKVRHDSLEDLIGSLDRTGSVTKEEMDRLRDGTCFWDGTPFLRVLVNRKDLESAGFVQVQSDDGDTPGVGAPQA